MAYRVGSEDRSTSTPGDVWLDPASAERLLDVQRMRIDELARELRWAIGALDRMREGAQGREER